MCLICTRCDQLLFSIWKLFESLALMHISAVKSLLSALRQLSEQCVPVTSSGSGPASSQKLGSISFSVERMISILVNNLHSTLCFEVLHKFVHIYLNIFISCVRLVYPV